MKNSKALKVFLIISGLLLMFIGSVTLFIPVDIKAGSGIDIAGNTNVINDTRASGALFLAMAIVIFSGAFVKKLTFTSTLISSLLFLSIGFGRILSIALDGMPVDGLIKATILEFILGITGIILFNIFKKK